MTQDKLTFAPLIVGTMRLGSWGAQYNTAQYEKFIEECLALNLTDFDHADIYGGHTTESEFGAVLKNRKDLRAKIGITTKCGIKFPSEVKTDIPLKHYDFSQKHIIDSVETSLRELNIEQIKLLLLHRPDYLFQPELVAETFETLQKQGKVAHFGVSNFTPTQFDLLHSYFPLVNNQIEVSLANPKAILDDSLFYFMKNKIAISAWSVLGGGAFFKESENPTLQNGLASLAKKYHCSIDQLLYAWVFKHPAKITPVTGTSKIERIKSALAAKKIEISQEDWYQLLEWQRGKEVA